MATVDVMARANLTVQGRLLGVTQEATLDDTDEVRHLISEELLVAREPDGGFPDLGPLDQRYRASGGCCGAKT